LYHGLARFKPKL